MDELTQRLSEICLELETSNIRELANYFNSGCNSNRPKFLNSISSDSLRTIESLEPMVKDISWSGKPLYKFLSGTANLRYWQEMNNEDKSKAQQSLNLKMLDNRFSVMLQEHFANNYKTDVEPFINELTIEEQAAFENVRYNNAYASKAFPENAKCLVCSNAIVKTLCYFSPYKKEYLDLFRETNARNPFPYFLCEKCEVENKIEEKVEQIVYDSLRQTLENVTKVGEKPYIGFFPTQIDGQWKKEAWAFPFHKASIEDIVKTFKGFNIKDEEKHFLFNFLCAEYFYKSLGEKRWFVDDDVLDLLKKSTTDLSNIDNIKIPHDTFKLVFKNGPSFVGEKVHSLIICRVFSKLSLSLLAKLNKLIIHDNAIQNANFLINGLQLFLYTRGHEKNKLYRISPNEMQLTDSENEILKIVIKAILYWNARPELVRDYTLPRSERYGFSNRKSIQRIYLPFKPKVLGKSISTGEGGSKRPHVRGWTFRTLRDERYRRNPDGTYKVVAVEPMVIHPEAFDMEEVGD